MRQISSRAARPLPLEVWAFAWAVAHKKAPDAANVEGLQIGTTQSIQGRIINNPIGQAATCLLRRRRARASSPPHAMISPGSPAPTIGPGTARMLTVALD